MPITIEGYTFEGPYKDVRMLRETTGVYVILDHYEGMHNYVDCGESEHVKSRVHDHDRGSSWESVKKGELEVAANYTLDRMNLEKKLRGKISFPCGEG